MKYMATVLLSTALTFGFSLAQELQQEKAGPEERNNRISYSIGYQIGCDLVKQSVELDTDALMKGVEEGLAAAEPQLSPEEMEKTLLELKRNIVSQQKAELVEREMEQLKIKEKYRGEGRDFLEANSKKDGVITLPSGLQYKVIQEGKGGVPGPNDTVLVDYRGTLIDGTEFDSTYHENKPSTFHVAGVIKGWTEALQLMKEGSSWQLYIPPDLAYGERGPLADRTVIFDLELISIEPSK